MFGGRTLFEGVNVQFSKADFPIWNHFSRGLEWADKAGGYAIQGLSGALFVKRIDGDYYNVVGLPLSRLYRELKTIGAM